MTQTSTLKSVSITALDTVPLVPVATGQGAPGMYRTVNDAVTVLSADSTSSTYRMCRFPTNAKIKSVKLYSAVASAGAADINVAFSDSPYDGTPLAAQGTIPQISSANNKLFGAAASLVAQSDAQCIRNNLSNFPPLTAQNQPVWQLLGFTDDPGGYFDILLAVTTQITTGGVVSLEVSFVV